MIVDVVMPKLGESITEGTIIQWLKSIGDIIEKEEILLEIGTDKVDSEIPSPAGGIIKEILAKPNDIIPVNNVIARIETEETIRDQTKSIDESQTVETSILSEKKIEQASTPNPLPQTTNGGGRTFFTPLVRSIARREGISDNELSLISGTGRSGRVTKGDIIAYLETRESTIDLSNQKTTSPEPTQEPKSASQIIRPIESIYSSQPSQISQPSQPPMAMDDRLEDMSRMRQAIADHMRQSIDTAAHVYLVSECDVTNVVNFVKERQEDFKIREGFKLTYTPFFILAAVKAIQAHPKFNASLEDKKIIYKKNINVGMAVAMKKGLMVPVISNCEELNFLGLCRKVNDLAIRGRNGKLSPDELQGSTFSVSNFGVFGNIIGMPIINQPNSAILGVGSVKKQPVVKETSSGDAIVIRSMCCLSIGIDHRLLDGADGGLFLKTMVELLENIDVSVLI
ncbi:MAG: hypothetical protein CMG75_00790 [Candidatus Marinimicrobia bacterium]|nr:hypothetical protein [Candidatus Neomarinimicrobiota bacterium]|tara:strand:+ start:29009 stop:30370 length:1362 start_codon:yes stop_codon:yes gene_type:complete